MMITVQNHRSYSVETYGIQADYGAFFNAAASLLHQTILRPNDPYYPCTRVDPAEDYVAVPE